MELSAGGFVIIIPYLTFTGDCEEAVNLYISILGGEILYLSRYTVDTGGRDLCGKVMHVEFKAAGSVMAAADSRKPIENTDTVRLMIHCETLAEADKIINAFGAQGKVLQRLMPHPPPDDGGTGGLVRDNYGYVWILTAPNDRK